MKKNNFKIPILSSDRIGYSIVALLSTFEEGTIFERDLLDQIKALYDKSSNEIVREHRFGVRRNDDLVDYVLINQEFGKWIGLSNRGGDFHYGIESRLHELVEKSKEIIGKENFNYFAELGKNLKAR